ncbi:MAG: cupin domain-containing protein [Lautropia sp.]|nr:cupin domain-containing protein [Lautropia sp.]
MKTHVLLASLSLASASALQAADAPAPAAASTAEAPPAAVDSHGTGSTDRSWLPEQLAPQPGKPVVVDENPAFGVKTLRLAIPPHKTLQPHGPRQGYFIVTVLSGTLQLGFGKTFDEARLQTLPAGSVFTHPAHQQHFARTGTEPVVLQLTAVNPPATDGHDRQTQSGNGAEHRH